MTREIIPGVFVSQLADDLFAIWNQSACGAVFKSKTVKNLWDEQKPLAGAVCGVPHIPKKLKQKIRAANQTPPLTEAEIIQVRALLDKPKYTYKMYGNGLEYCLGKMTQDKKWEFYHLPDGGWRAFADGCWAPCRNSLLAGAGISESDLTK